MILFPTADEDYQYFVSQGYSGSINDMHYQALGVLGYTGSYTDRLYAYLVATYGSYHQALYDLRTGVSTFALGDAYTVDNKNPNLVFDFASEYYRTSANVSTFSDSLTYTGASSKTMVDSDGLLKWAPHNLVRYSTDMASMGTTNITLTKTATSPFGVANDAFVLTDTSDGSALGHTVSDLSLHDTDNNTRTQSIWLKAGTAAFVSLTIAGNTNSLANCIVVNLSTGSIVSTGVNWTSSAIAVSGTAGWYLVTGVYPSDSTSRDNFGIQIMTDATTLLYQGDGTATVNAWGAHVYRSDLGGMVDNPDRSDSYVPTTSAAVYLPRRGHHIYNGSTWVNEGILLESEARTNLITYSHEFDNAAWAGPANVTVTPNTATGPDGVSSADTMANTAGNEGLYKTCTCSTNTVYTNSVYIKKKAIGDADTPGLYIMFFTGGVTTIAAVVINTYTGALTVGTAWGLTVPLAYSGENCGDYWRLSISGDSVDNTEVRWAFYNDFNPTTGTAAIGDQQIYGAQIEEGSTPSSYIPTSGATVTRAAETLTVAAANLPYSAVNMSMQMDGEMTYADEGVNSQETMVRWYSNGNDYIVIDVDTFSAATGEVNFRQKATALDLVIASSTYLSPGVNVSYNLASRHGATLLNGALDGTALTANETPTSLPDLSATNMLIASTYMGTIGKFRMWDEDLGDTGIATASARTYTTEFAMIVATTTASETFTIPCQNAGTFNAGIDWGDGQVSTITAYNDAALTHTYATAGDHVIRITGTFPNIYFNNGGDKLKVKSVENLGEVGWTKLNRAFYGCTNLTSFTAGTTDTSAVTDMTIMFYGCTSLTTLDVSSFNTALVTNLSLMFYGCSSVTTLDVSSFNTALVTDLSLMFYNCASVTTLDVSGFNTASVTTMNGMFRACTSVTALDVSGFNTALVTNMDSMFNGCSSVTALDVSSFNTALVTNMSLMFWGCSSVTDIIGVDTFDIGGLNSTGDLTSFALNVTLPTARYDALLIAWEAQDPFDGMSPNFGSSTYTGGGAVATAHASLISRDGWTITDGGAA